MRNAIALGTVFLVASCNCDDVVNRPPVVFSGVICNPLDGAPIANAGVQVLDGEGVLVDEPRTGGDGKLEVTLAEGEYVFNVDGDGFRRALSVTLVSGEDGGFLDDACRVPPSAPGNGFVAGAFCAVHTGGTVVGAVVTVEGSDGSVVAEGVTDENGEMRLEVPAGTVTVSVIATGLRKQYVVEVEEGAVVVVEQQICAAPPFASTNHIVGKVCLQDGVDLSTATTLARWRLDSTETEITGTVDADGTFDLDGIAPTPLRDVYVEVSVGALRRSWNVPLVVGRGEQDGVDVAALPAVGDDDLADGCVPLLPDDERRYLVVQGQFDSIESVLFRMALPNVELLDGSTSTWAESLLSSRDNLERYDAVFVNCGVDETEWSGPGGLSIIARRTLKDYVDAGGALYVSDLAYDLIEQVFPDAIDFFGDDSVVSGAELSEGGSYVADVVDADLAADLGVAEFDLDFNFGSGAVVDSVDASVDVLLQTDLRLLTAPGEEQLVLADTPISVAFDSGLGRVVFSSFHQEVVDGEAEAVDGPEDEMLQLLVFQLDR